MSAISDVFAGIPISNLDASVEWYTRFFGRPPDSRMGQEVLWEIEQHAWVFIEPNAAHAGAGRITFAVAGLDPLLERLTADGIQHEPIETYSNGVRHVRPRSGWQHDRAPSRPTLRASNLNRGDRFILVHQDSYA